jgi:hypothetical protein
MSSKGARRSTAPAHAVIFLLLGALPFEEGRGGRGTEAGSRRREGGGRDCCSGRGSSFDGKPLAELLNLLGEGVHFGSLVFGTRLEHLLALKEDLKLPLSVLQLVLGAPQLLHCLVPIPTRTVVQDFSGQASLLFAAVSKLQSGNRVQGSLEGIACRASEHSSGLEASQGALKGTPLLL